MPWHLPAELKYFRARTLGKPVIMGRKTFQSIGKPLPGRDNIVITRDATFAAPGVTVARSLPDAIGHAEAAARRSGAAEIMIIGGASIYALALPQVSRVYLTRVCLAPAGDAHFGPLDAGTWPLIEEKPIIGCDPAASACIYERQRG